MGIWISKKNWNIILVILIVATIIAAYFTWTSLREEKKDDLRRLGKYDLTPSLFETLLIVAWFAAWGVICVWKRQSQNVIKLVVTSLLGFIIITAGLYMGARVLRTIADSNELIEGVYYLPIENPYDRNETMPLIVIHNTSSLIAQESWVTTHVILKVNQTYRGDDIPLVKNPPENFTIVFEGSFCDDDFNNFIPNPNYEIGFACTLLLNRSSDNITYTGTEYPRYFSEGVYDVLLATGNGTNANFTSTSADFIKIRPVESYNAISLDKLGVYSTILSIVVAMSAAIIALIWTGRTEFGNKR